MGRKSKKIYDPVGNYCVFCHKFNPYETDQYNIVGKRSKIKYKVRFHQSCLMKYNEEQRKKRGE